MLTRDGFSSNSRFRKGLILCMSVLKCENSAGMTWAAGVSSTFWPCALAVASSSGRRSGSRSLSFQGLPKPAKYTLQGKKADICRFALCRARKRWVSSSPRRSPGRGRASAPQRSRRPGRIPVKTQTWSRE